MSTGTVSGQAPGIAQLVSGIASDMTELVKEQVALLRQEVHDDLTKTKQATSCLAVGASLALIGGSFLCVTFVYLLAALLPDLPLWGCFAIVGAVVSGTAGALVYAGLQKLQSFNPLPDESAAALKENIQWKTPN